MGFGAELKRILEKKKIRVAQLSRDTGIPANTLYAIINRDSNNVSVSNLDKICNALDLESDDYAILDMNLYPEKWFKFSHPNSTDKEIAKEYLDMGEKSELILDYFKDEFTEEELNDLRNYIAFIKSKRTSELKEMGDILKKISKTPPEN